MKTILIVDDNRDAILLTQIALSMLDLELRTETATGGQEALELLDADRDPPALILLDLKMPGMDGIETLRKIRSNDRLMHIPVVILTLSTLATDKEAAREAGASDFMSKAIRIEDFSRDIERLVRLHI